MHWGVDIAADPGTEVRAARAGIVADVAPNGRRIGYGNTVIVEHPDGTLTLYAHLQSFGPGISKGTQVAAGTVLGYVGNTHAPSTTSMRPHLHFEVLKSKATTPAGYIIVNPTTPGRYEPQAWLASQGVPVAATA